MKNLRYKNWGEQLAHAWASFPPPARPSHEEVNIFEKYVDFHHFEKRKKLKILILGSTPEFRDIFNKKYFRVYCMDINKAIYDALTLLLKHKNQHEKLINKNWLDFKVHFKFDIVIGDNVTGMIPLTKYSQFFNNIFQHLQHDGLMIIRSIIQNNKFDITPQESIEKYRRLYKGLNINIFTATHNNFFHYYLNKKRSEFSMPLLLKKLQELYKKGLYTKEEYNKLIFYYTSNNLTISIPKDKDLLKILSPFFYVVAKEFGLDYLTSYNNPIYILKRKS